MQNIMRRKDRELSRDEALAVIDKCQYAVMATVNPDGSPYCLPLSIAREGESIFFHSAKEGHKIDNIRKNNSVCLTCAGDVETVPGEFALFYESAIVNGTAHEITEREEMIHALKVISQRHTPDVMAMFDSEIKKDLGRTAVWKISINNISGKGRRKS